jgi:hypothetical protein
MTEDINKDAEYSAEKDPMHPLGKDCSICGTDYEDEEWGVMGWIGTLPLSLCPTCEAGVFNMVYSLTPVEVLQELIEELSAEKEAPKKEDGLEQASS